MRRFLVFYQTAEEKAADKAKVQATDKEQVAEAAQVPALVQDLAAEVETAMAMELATELAEIELLELRRRRRQCQKV